MKSSPGVLLIWRFAVGEAERSDHEFVEPEHFVQAMTRGESLSDDEMLKLVILDEAAPKVESGLKNYFRAEFINRIDQIVVFQPITEDNALVIARKIVGSLEKRLASTMGMRLTVTDAALRLVVETGHSDEFGVRHLRRVVEELIEAPLAQHVLGSSKRVSREIIVDIKAGELVFR